MTAVDPHVSVQEATRGPVSVRDVVMAYVGLTKPRIIELLLLTTVPVMFLAQRGVPPLGLVVATVVGGTLSAGSANALNCVYDADIDQRMRRTRRRALPRHIVSTRAALVFGLLLGVLSTVLLWTLVNPLSAALALAANVFYVVGYTMILKRRTTQNIVWGGAAGCFPALIGWTAVTGSLAWAPVVLFLVVFFWTPPHFWALAIRYREDYAAAERADAPGRGRGEGRRTADRPLLLRHGGHVAGAVAGGADRLALPGRGRRCSGRRSWSSPTCCWAAPRRATTWWTSSRCGSSTGRTCTSPCCSSRSRSTRC